MVIRDVLGTLQRNYEMAITAQDVADYLQANPGMTDSQILSTMNQYGVSPQLLSQATGVSVADITARAQVVSPSYVAPTPVYTSPSSVLNALQSGALNQSTVGAALQQVANQTLAQPVTATPTSRPVTPTPVTQPVTAPRTVTPLPVTPTAPLTATQQMLQWFQNNPNRTDAQVVQQMNALGLNQSDISNITGVSLADINARMGAVPAASQTGQGLMNSFAQYQSIAPNAAYNPAYGSASPYSKIMGQMGPGSGLLATNPYQNAPTGALGGYDPSKYDALNKSLAMETAKNAAAEEAARNPTYTGFSDAYMGGYMDKSRVSGANPPGPDDGATNIQTGEYIIKKSSVKKYGKGLLDMINEGTVSAKKIKSLLG